jgi:hypothetical protein
MTYGKLILIGLRNVILLTILSALVLFWVSLVVCVAYLMFQHLYNTIVVTLLVLCIWAMRSSDDDTTS